MTIIEKILANHSGKTKVFPGDIVDVEIDVRLARDFGGANVVKNIEENNLDVANVAKTWFTFDCNPSGSDQKYAANQQYCRHTPGHRQRVGCARLYACFYRFARQHSGSHWKFWAGNGRPGYCSCLGNREGVV
jgi:homoaconitase/3-isopropylmalate dehydratase large subunit